MARKTKASEDRPQLGRLEMEIMEVVWQLGESSSTNIVDAVQAERDLAPTTICTVLLNLRKKGYVDLVPTVERSHWYKPVRAIVLVKPLISLVTRTPLPIVSSQNSGAHGG